MAEEVIKKLEDQLNCAICLETYIDPKELQCFHVFCRQCVVKLEVRDQQGQLSLTCPICRQATLNPANGVAGLQSAFYINRMLEIRDTFKEAKDPVEKTEGDTTYPIPPRKGYSNCPEHAEELKLFCETCGVLICCKCSIKGGKHHDHDYEPIHKAFEKCEKELTCSLEPMEEKLASVNKALVELDKHCGEISDQREAIKENMHDSIRQLIETLEVRKTQLICELHRMTQEKLKGLAVQRDQLESIQIQLSSCLEFAKERGKKGHQGEVLKMKTNLVKQVKELTTAFQPDVLKPDTEADMIFSASPDATVMCQNYGQVYTQGQPSPSRCHAKGKGLEDAVVGEKSTAIVFAVNHEGGPCTKPLKTLQSELVSEITGATVRGSVERKELNLYEISYQPTTKGRHQLHIKVDEQHIRGSPFSVAVKLPVMKLGAPIQTIDGVRPFGVTVNQRGEVVVTESDGQCVSLFSPSGEELQSFGTHGSDQGQFKCPSGIAVDGNGNILVVDSNNNRIQKFTADGQFLTAVGTRGDGPLQFYNPYGIALNASNNKVYVLDTFNDRIQVLSSDLTFSSTFGRQGSGKGQFHHPVAISCDSIGNVYVADRNNHRIQVFTAEGQFLRTFGKHGEGRGELNTPDGIAVDENDVVYVSDTYNHRISVFTSEGQFMTSFGGKGKGPGEVNCPYGLAVDDSGVVYVCDGHNNRIQMF